MSSAIRPAESRHAARRRPRSRRVADHGLARAEQPDAGVRQDDRARAARPSRRPATSPTCWPVASSRRRSLMVAGLVPTISVPQFLPTVQALTEALDAAGYQLILGQSGYDHSREEALLNTMLSRRPDGIVVTGLVHSPAAREQLRAPGHSGGRDLGPERPAGRHAGGLLAPQGGQRDRRLLSGQGLAAARHRHRRRPPRHDAPRGLPWRSWAARCRPRSCRRPAAWHWGRRAMGELLQQDPHARRPSTAARTSWRTA